MKIENLDKVDRINRNYKKLLEVLEKIEKVSYSTHVDSDGGVNETTKKSLYSFYISERKDHSGEVSFDLTGLCVGLDLIHHLHDLLKDRKKEMEDEIASL